MFLNLWEEAIRWADNTSNGTQNAVHAPVQPVAAATVASDKSSRLNQTPMTATMKISSLSSKYPSMKC